MNWKEELIRANNTTQTTNGDLAYRSTLNPHLDLFYQMGALTGDGSLNDLVNIFEGAYLSPNKADSNLALSALLYLRDPRGGLGWRKSFRYLLNHCLTSEDMLKLATRLPHYGRWDDILDLINNPRLNSEDRDALITMVHDQLEQDLDSGDNTSLLAKWLPSENASSPVTKHLALCWRKALGMDAKTYRKTLSRLRKELALVENNLREKDYSFSYDHLPSRAMVKYRKAFLRNDTDRFQAYTESLTQDPDLKDFGNLYPHEIIHKLRETICPYGTTLPDNTTKADQDFLSAVWSTYVRNLPEDAGNTLVIRDGSGSMYSQAYGTYRCIDIADALCLLFSQALTGPFKDSFITFSSRPDFVTFNENQPITNRLRKLYNYDDCSNTNLEKVYQMLLDLSQKVTDPKDYITRLVIVSDMQFDQATDSQFWFYDCCSIKAKPTESVIATYKKKFAQASIPFPELVFWNLEPNVVTFPTDKYENVKLLSGYSTYAMESIIKDQTASALDYMLETLEPYYLDLTQQ